MAPREEAADASAAAADDGSAGTGFVSCESFERALRGQDMHIVQEIGKRLLEQKNLLEKAHEMVLEERRALSDENVRLNAEIADTIRALAEQDDSWGGEQPTPSMGLGHLVQYFVEPCTVPYTPPASPSSVSTRHFADSASKASPSMGTSLRAAPMKREASPEGPPDALSFAVEEAVAGFAEFGRLVTRQFSDVWSAIADGEGLFDVQCSRGGKCCSGDPLVSANAVHAAAGSSSLTETDHLEGDSLNDGYAAHEFRPGLSTDSSPTLAGPSPGLRAALDPERALQLQQQLQQQRYPAMHAQAVAVAAAAAASSATPSVSSVAWLPAATASADAPSPSPAGAGGALLIEASLRLEGMDVAPCQVFAAERCGEVAARFVSEHSLKLCFEAPLAAYLTMLEADSDEFPVFATADLTDLRRQYLDLRGASSVNRSPG